MKGRPKRQASFRKSERVSDTARIQVTLTPAESKRLIAKAVKKTPIIQRALREGTIIVDKSTTDAYILDELIEEKVDVSRYVSGIVTMEGTCLTNRREALKTRILVKGKPKEIVQPAGKRTSTVFKELLEDMGEKDVFIKSANALDPEWHAGILAGASGCGIIGRVLPTIRRRKVNLLIPVGLEKLIPTSIFEASKEAGIFKMDSSMGMPCNLVPVEGTVITEMEAIDILTGAVAIPIAAGGVSGAEGAVTLVIRGAGDQVQAAKEVLLDVKGEQRIDVPRMECGDCPRHYTHYTKAPTIPKPCPGFWK